MYAFWKRFLDIILAALLLVLLSPLFLLIMLAIAADTKGNVIFIQKRAGLYGKPFFMLKFRTMFSDTPKNIATRSLRHANRHITPVGRFLRRTSLDELPQLWNILKGDMSFIGPRPVIFTEMDLIILRRTWGADQVRPGITGLAQVRGRDRINNRAKARYDAYYTRHQSFRLDIWILLQTIRCVATGAGIQEGVPSPDTSSVQNTSRDKSRP